MYKLQKYADEIKPFGKTLPPLRVDHNIIYLLRGSITVNDQDLSADNSVYVSEFADIHVGKDGATLWRWGISREGAALSLMEGRRD